MLAAERSDITDIGLCPIVKNQFAIDVIQQGEKMDEVSHVFVCTGKENRARMRSSLGFCFPNAKRVFSANGEDMCFDLEDRIDEVRESSKGAVVAILDAPRIVDLEENLWMALHDVDLLLAQMRKKIYWIVALSESAHTGWEFEWKSYPSYLKKKLAGKINARAFDFFAEQYQRDTRAFALKVLKASGYATLEYEYGSDGDNGFVAVIEDEIRKIPFKEGMVDRHTLLSQGGFGALV